MMSYKSILRTLCLIGFMVPVVVWAQFDEAMKVYESAKTLEQKHHLWTWI